MASQQAHIPGYVLADKLGSGTYASVYRAFAKGTKREVVAIKCVEKASLNRNATENLLTEIAILKKIKHDHIVEMKDFLWDDKYIYIIMEFCNGGELSTFIKSRRTLPEKVVKRFLQQLAAALLYIRSQNIAHMDLKPQNILLSSKENPVLKVADFGFAQYLKPQDDATSMRGSPLYMAPEILLKHKYDARVDLWSVGVILYECCFGRAPYSSQSFSELARKIMNPKQIEIPYGVNISDDCRDLISRLLQRDPDKRISFEEFFNHPFIDLEHMPTAQSYDKAVNLVVKAVEKDNQGEYANAIKLYCQALQHFVAAIDYEKNVEMKEHLRERVQKYFDRAEELKIIIKPKAKDDEHVSPLKELIALAANSPHMHAALKIIEVAEDLVSSEMYEIALEKYELALGALIPMLKNEPNGKRKETLHQHVKIWMTKAESIKEYLSMIQFRINGTKSELCEVENKEMAESIRQQCCVQ